MKLRLDGIGVFLLGISAVIAVIAGTAIALGVLPMQCRDTACTNQLDIVAQVNMANAAWAMVYISIISMLIGMASIALIYRTLQDTTATANASVAAAKTAEAAIKHEKMLATRRSLQERIDRASQIKAMAERQRPYVYLTAAFAEVKGNTFAMDMFIHNSGERAAVGVFDIKVKLKSKDCIPYELPPKRKTIGIVTGGRDSVRTVPFSHEDIQARFGHQEFSIEAEINLKYYELNGQKYSGQEEYSHTFNFRGDLNNKYWQLDDLFDVVAEPQGN